jgi:hypothetical protein
VEAHRKPTNNKTSRSGERGVFDFSETGLQGVVYDPLRSALDKCRWHLASPAGVKGAKLSAPVGARQVPQALSPFGGLRAAFTPLRSGLGKCHWHLAPLAG